MEDLYKQFLCGRSSSGHDWDEHPFSYIPYRRCKKCGKIETFYKRFLPVKYEKL